MTSDQHLVLVTGGSGFIASHCIARLLEEGYRVRATVRSLDRADAVRELVAHAGQDASNIEFAVADLNDDAGWAEALAGCDGVLHVASPVAHTEPKDPEDVIRPAREGTLRVLRAAHEAGVPRVVLTSAFGAVGFGHGVTEHRFAEEDWAVLDGPGMSTYNRSKTLAEQAAWEYVENEGKGLELVTMCPVAVFGPVLGSKASGGNEVVRRLLSGQLPVTVGMWFPVVDVRDVAIAHVAALRVPEAAGKRFIIGSGEGLTMTQIAAILREGLGEAGARVARHQVPNGIIRTLAKILPVPEDVAVELGWEKNIDVSRAEKVLGLHPRPARETILDAGRSMLERGVVVPKQRTNLLATVKERLGRR